MLAYTTSRKRPAFLFTLLLLGLLVVVAFFSANAIVPPIGVMARGVFINNVEVSALSTEQATDAVAASLQSVTNQQITFLAGGQQRIVQLAQLGIKPNIRATIDMAYAIGHRGSFLQRLQSAMATRWHSTHIEPTFSLRDAALKSILTDFSQRINQLPVDPTARWDGTRVVITPGQNGAKLDVPASEKVVHAQVLSAIAARRPTPAEITLVYREKYPRIATKALEQVDSLLGSFSTSYASSSRNRAANVERAAKSLQHTILMPGEVCSFNDVVGPRTAAAGYRMAPVIVDGQLEQGLGGGVCQVSTTLYNAVLYSGLEIVARSHHSLPSHYVKPGQDATVVYGATDLKFRNSSDAPIIIESSSGGGRLQMQIFGRGPAPKVQIVRSDISSIPSPAIHKNDPSLPAGIQVLEQKGKNGIAVTMKRIIGEGEEARTEILSHDRYQGQPAVILVGTGVVPPESTPEGEVVDTP